MATTTISFQNFMIYLSGDDLLFTSKVSQSFSNSNLQHLQSSSNPNFPPVPELLWSCSYSEPLPAISNAATHPFHPDISANTSSEGSSETSTSSKGNAETSSNSTPSNPTSALMSLECSWSQCGDGVAFTASDIIGCIIEVICDIKG